jgi:hypothetical protein
MTSGLKAKAALSERGDDLYETPPVAVIALLEREALPSVVWEPACGPGAIVGPLRAAGHTVIATDLIGGAPLPNHDATSCLRSKGVHRFDWTGPRASSATAYAWFVWDRTHSGPPVLDRISGCRYRVRASMTDIKSVVAGNERRIRSALGIRRGATR